MADGQNGWRVRQFLLALFASAMVSAAVVASSLTWWETHQRGAEHTLIVRALSEQAERLEGIFYAVLLSPRQRTEELENLPMPRWVQDMREKKARDEWLKRQPPAR